MKSSQILLHAAELADNSDGAWGLGDYGCRSIVCAIRLGSGGVKSDAEIMKSPEWREAMAWFELFHNPVPGRDERAVGWFGCIANPECQAHRVLSLIQAATIAEAAGF